KGWVYRRWRRHHGRTSSSHLLGVSAGTTTSLDGACGGTAALALGWWPHRRWRNSVADDGVGSVVLEMAPDGWRMVLRG
ncbi:hypothetical protein U1Q18_014407, partial [Sarracenia purpurea var. burkii]